MGYLTAIIICVFSSTGVVLAQSNLLETVKRNPEEAKLLCKQFRDMNSKGISINSNEAISEISSKRNLSKIDAEILSIYVIGLHCPDVN